MIDLKQTTFDQIPYFTFDGMIVSSKIVDIYDGDTFSAVFERAGELIKVRCRLDGIDTPEMKPPYTAPNRDQIKQRAIAARNRLCELLTGTEWEKPADRHSHLVTLVCRQFDKYGRLLVDVDNVAQVMINEGHAVEYHGGTKLLFL